MPENLDHLDLPVWRLPGGAHVAAATAQEALDLLMSPSAQRLHRDLYDGVEGYLPLRGIPVDAFQPVNLVALDAEDETENGDPVLVRADGRVDLENLGAFVYWAHERAAEAARQRTPGTPEYRAAVEAAGQLTIEAGGLPAGRPVRQPQGPRLRAPPPPPRRGAARLPRRVAAPGAADHEGGAMKSLSDPREAGYEAGVKGWKITACPRDGRTVEGRTWREGWRVGAAQYERAREKAVGLAVDLLEGRNAWVDAP